MKIYVAMVEDRHTDPEPHLFTTPEAAIAFAREYYQDNRPTGLDDEDLEDADVGEHEHEPNTDVLYSATYSLEGDSVWVVEKDLVEVSSGTPEDQEQR